MSTQRETQQSDQQFARDIRGQFEKNSEDFIKVSLRDYTRLLEEIDYLQARIQKLCRERLEADNDFRARRTR